jgi:autophagy-related protein 17
VFQEILSRTEDYPESLHTSVTTIKNRLPVSSPSPCIKGVLMSQDAASVNLANHLESLAAHYDQMARACSESEAGEAFSEEDLQGMCWNPAFWASNTETWCVQR